MNIKLALIALLSTFGMNTFAGGYHCKLQVESFKQPYENSIVIKVKKIEKDRALYTNGEIANWQMIQEKVGDTFTVHFKFKELDDKAKECIEHIKQAHKAGKPVEFGFAETANNLQGKQWYVSNALTYFHKTKDGAICVHGS